jgi:cell filamentation protein
MRVLRNRLGVHRKMEMDRLEFEALVVTQEKYLGRVGPGTRLTAEMLCRMHSDWLGGIYEWAGHYRTVELAKGGFRWPPAFRVAQNMSVFEKGALARCTPCRPDSLAEVARSLAEVHAELLLIHPFREGNGRLARWVSDLMALQADLPTPDYGFTGPGAVKRRTAYLDAVTKGYIRDYEPLAGFFVAALERQLRRRWRS